ncbi:MAG: MBOAT family O-acyltransferase [Candidatus Omnitrophota bacterium]
MSFVTPEFWVFFLIVFLIYVLLKHRQQNLFLLAASYFFYAWWDWRFLSLLFISSTTDYLCGLAIDRNHGPGIKKRYLILGLSINLSILLFFKSFNFFISSLNPILAFFGLSAHTLHLQVILPLGISFYTFQTMGYLIDVYRGGVKPVRHFTDYLLYVSFFPQLIAGPIERAKHLYHQIENQRIISWSHIRTGVYLIYWGLFQKIFIANHCAVLSEKLLSDPAGSSGAGVLVALYAFAFQIYCDISGYTDIARGTAKLMGFDLTINFRQPYFARNISDFWRRWHMSMTYWFRDYVFFPVLAYHKGNAYLASFVTLLCISLWHSISLSSIFRGVYFGIAVAIFHWYKTNRASSGPDTAPKWVRAVTGFASWFATFHIVCLGWLFFYPISIRHAVTQVAKIFSDFQFDVFITNLRILFMYIFILVLVQVWQAARKEEFVLLKTNIVFKVVFYWLTFWLFLSSGSSANLPFIYFGI